MKSPGSSAFASPASGSPASVGAAVGAAVWQSSRERRAARSTGQGGSSRGESAGASTASGGESAAAGASTTSGVAASGALKKPKASAVARRRSTRGIIVSADFLGEGRDRVTHIQATF